MAKQLKLFDLADCPEQSDRPELLPVRIEVLPAARSTAQAEKLSARIACMLLDRFRDPSYTDGPALREAWLSAARGKVPSAVLREQDQALSWAVMQGTAVRRPVSAVKRSPVKKSPVKKSPAKESRSRSSVPQSKRPGRSSRGSGIMGSGAKAGRGEIEETCDREAMQAYVRNALQINDLPITRITQRVAQDWDRAFTQAGECRGGIMAAARKLHELRWPTPVPIMGLAPLPMDAIYHLQFGHPLMNSTVDFALQMYASYNNVGIVPSETISWWVRDNDIAAGPLKLLHTGQNRGVMPVSFQPHLPHFGLLAVDLNEKTIYMYDPLPSCAGRNLRTYYKAAAEGRLQLVGARGLYTTATVRMLCAGAAAIEKSLKRQGTMTLSMMTGASRSAWPVQENVVDCGVMTIEVARRFMCYGASLGEEAVGRVGTDEHSIRYRRLRIAIDLIQHYCDTALYGTLEGPGCGVRTTCA